MINTLKRLCCRLRVSHGPWTRRPDLGADDERWYTCWCGHLAKARPGAGERGVPWVGQVAADERTEGDQ